LKFILRHQGEEVIQKKIIEKSKNYKDNQLIEREKIDFPKEKQKKKSKTC